LAGSRLINQGDPPHSWRQHPLDPWGVSAFGATNEGGSRPDPSFNVLAPYVLTALMHKPDRLVYLSSGMHTGGAPSLDDPQWSGAVGTAAKPMRTPSSTTCCSPSAFRGAGPMCCRMRSPRDGCRATEKAEAPAQRCAIRWVRRCGELVQEIERGCTLLACAEQQMLRVPIVTARHPVAFHRVQEGGSF
jgi:hypothetical protein